MSHIVSTSHILAVAEPESASRISRILAPFGYILHIVTDSSEAMRSVAEEPPEVVIISGALAGTAGFSLLRTLRTSRGTEELPVMFLAGNVPDDEVRAYQLGAEDVFKPDTSDVALRARLRVLLDRKSVV